MLRFETTEEGFKMSGLLSVKFLLEIGHNCSSPPYLLHSAINLGPEDRVPTREGYFICELLQEIYFPGI